MLESLESRRLLSVTLDQGVLTVTGIDGADQLAVGRNPTTNMIVVNDNGTPSSFDPADVQRVVINGLDGNDRIGVGPGVMRPIAIDAGAGDDSVNGGSGPEHIMGGPGNDRIAGGGGGDVLAGGDDDDAIVGGAGSDTMLGGDGADRFDAVDLSADLVDGGAGEDYAAISRGDHTINVEHVRAVPPHHPGESLLDLPTDLADKIASADQLVNELA